MNKKIEDSTESSPSVSKRLIPVGQQNIFILSVVVYKRSSIGAYSVTTLHTIYVIRGFP